MTNHVCMEKVYAIYKAKRIVETRDQGFEHRQTAQVGAPRTADAAFAPHRWCAPAALGVEPHPPSCGLLVLRSLWRCKQAKKSHRRMPVAGRGKGVARCADAQ